MNQRLIVSSAFASALALGLIGSVAAHDMGSSEGKEKCYGIAKAGQNDCGNLAGSHSCAGEATVDADPGEWKYVAKGTCKALKGKTEAEAKNVAMHQPRLRKPPHFFKMQLLTFLYFYYSPILHRLVENQA